MSLCGHRPLGHKLKQGWTISHESNHTKNGTKCQLCGNLLLLPAGVDLLTNDHGQIEFHLLRMGERILNAPHGLRPMSARRNVDISPQSIKVTAVERGSRGRIDPASWLLEEIGISSVTQFYDLSWSNPTTEWMSLYQAIKFMEWSVILNRHMLSFLNSLQLWNIKSTVLDAAFH